MAMPPQSGIVQKILLLVFVIAALDMVMGWSR
jgi:hypothetical protein